MTYLLLSESNFDLCASTDMISSAMIGRVKIQTNTLYFSFQHFLDVLMEGITSVFLK